MSTHSHDKSGWIGVDFDGTLAEYHGWTGPYDFGPPIPAMLIRVKDWLSQGIEVRIFTARVGPADPSLVAPDYPRDVVASLQAWCVEHIGVKLEITSTKDFAMWQLWDDRAVQVEKNTGLAYVHPHERISTP
jgi:hypothetical protein